MQVDLASLVAVRPAELVLVAGPNGSGKSSIADLYIQARFPLWPKLNADRVLLKLELLERQHPASKHLISLRDRPALGA